MKSVTILPRLFIQNLSLNFNSKFALIKYINIRQPIKRWSTEKPPDLYKNTDNSFFSANEIQRSYNYNSQQLQQIQWVFYEEQQQKQKLYDENSNSSSSSSNTNNDEYDGHGNDNGHDNDSEKGDGKANFGSSLGIGGVITSGAFSFNLFSSNDDEANKETPEDKLINTIKRSMICIQAEEFDKAERMLHLALRMAQDLQSKEGITYVYDIMANLAMEQEQYKKAERLFTDVMRRLFADGYADDSPQVLHISVKMAHMAQLQGDLEKADIGFKWTLQKLNENLKKMPGDKEVQELLGLTKNWFGQLLMKQGKYSDAKISFQEAYECFLEIYGADNKEAITILNNLSVACVNMENLAEAEKYLLQALDMVKTLKDDSQEGILKANLGLVYLQEGLVTQAKEFCNFAYRIGMKTKNSDAVEQAEYCLNEIKTFMEKNN